MFHLGLNNRVAIITGGGRGIGEATARLFASEGAYVVVAARTEHEVREVAKSINGLTVVCDVRDAAQCEWLVARAIQYFGRIDFLVNNAGAVHPAGPFLSIDDDAWKEMSEVNVAGPARLTRLVAQHLIEREAPGAIVNVTSAAGLGAAPSQSAYGASKAALISLTQTAAKELGRYGIRVNAVTCGLIRTQMAAPVFTNERLYGRYVQKTPLGTSGEPEDIAQAIAFLASPVSRFTTGHIMVIDGGISL